MIDIQVGNKTYTIDLFMLNESEVFFEQFSPLLSNLNNKIYIIPEKYLDDDTYKMWYKLYELRKTHNLFPIEKPLPINILNIMHSDFYNFLKEYTYEQVIKLGELFEYLKMEIFFDLICAFVAFEYLR